MKLLLCLLSFFIALKSSAQSGSVAGEIIDSIGQQPLDYASVSLLNSSDNKLIAGAVTDVKGKFKIDTKRLKELFDAGFQNPLTGVHETYNRLIVGMGPGGLLSLWCNGAMVIKLVQSYHADSFSYDWKKFAPTSPFSRGEYINAQLRDVLNMEKLSQQPEVVRDPIAWQQFAEAKIPYGLNTIVIDKPQRIFIFYANGERIAEDFELSRAADSAGTSYPSEITYYWSKGGSSTTPATNGMYITFRPEEMVEAFAAIGSHEGNTPSIQVELGSSSSKVFLRDKERVFQFKKCKIRYFK